MRRFRRAEAPALVGALAAAVAGFVLLVPAARFQVISPAAVPIVLAARGMAEVFAGFLAGQRFVRNASPVDFGIAFALGITVVADVVYMLNRSTLAPDGSSAAAVLPYHLVSATVLAAAALAPRRPMFARGRGSLILVALAMPALVPLLLMVSGAIPDYGVTGSLEPHGEAVLRLVVCGLLLVAVVGLACNRDTRNQPLTRWLAVAAFVAALVEIQRVAEPVSTVATFTWLEVWHLGVALALFVGALGEVRFGQRRLARLAVADERRRLARDLHDGVAQDMAYIASQSKYLASRSGDQRLRQIAVAADRALDDSRAVVEELTRTPLVSLNAALELEAEQFQDRWGLHVRLALECEVDPGREKEDAILRIVGEALSNVARHSAASAVEIRLGYRRGRLLVAVSDNGRGFDAGVERMADRGFGLRNMSERAGLLGGEVRIVSEPGRGTLVEILVP